MFASLSSQKVALIATCVGGAIGFAAAFTLQSSNDRYSIISVGDGKSHKIDRKTGKTWLIQGQKVEELHGPDFEVSEPPLTNVPSNELEQVNGTANYAIDALFGGKLYNGSEWQIRRIRVLIESAPGQPEWSRYFWDDVTLQPESTGTFQVDTMDGHRANAVTWKIVEAKGFKQ